MPDDNSTNRLNQQVQRLLADAVFNADDVIYAPTISIIETKTKRLEVATNDPEPCVNSRRLSPEINAMHNSDLHNAAQDILADEINEINAGPWAVAVASWRRTVAGATSENKWAVFKLVAREIGFCISKGLGRADAADILNDIADANYLIEARGQDVVQQVISAAFAEADANAERVPDPWPNEAPHSKTNGKGTAAEPTGLGEWDAGDDVEVPPPRGWLLGNMFCRKFMSSLIGDGGVGKTATRYAQYLSLATARNLTGEHVFQRARVLIISLEDDCDELRRRILAARLHHKIELAEVSGWLFLSAPGAAAGKLMITDDKGRAVRGRLAANIEQTVITRKIDLVAIDPFVKSHSVEENKNSVIDDVAQVLTDLSAKHNIAIDVPHHVSKGPADPGNADRGRGASALKDAGRIIQTVTAMSSDEAAAFGIKEDDRRSYIRIDNGKVNIIKHHTAAKWFQLISVRLGNATELYPSGDEVQTVEPWSPPDIWAFFPIDVINRVLDDIDAGLPDGNRYTDAPNATDRGAWRVVIRFASDKTEAQAREIIRTWVRNGVLFPADYTNPTTRKAVKGLKVDPTKRPGRIDDSQ